MLIAFVVVAAVFAYVVLGGGHRLLGGEPIHRSPRHPGSGGVEPHRDRRRIRRQRQS
ncbi:hypothetical protein [Methanoculleus chikugoensis]|uniref:hypothetical protein n=1 Tax=Methanoculleus chikugoensis TaxID=118126 RepID=UPI001FB350EA|nr:hypothetical protein [Methanoculleus chikugoensis]